jgi:hypothetical protein
MPHNELSELVKASNPVPDPAALLDQESDVRALFEDVMRRANDPHASIYQLGGDVNWRRNMETKQEVLDLEPSPVEPETRRWSAAALAVAAAVIAILVLAVILRDGETNSNFISNDTTTTIEASTTTEVSTTVAAASNVPRQQSSPVISPNNADVPDSLATLQATEDDAAFTIVTSGLEPGHPVTAWLFAMDVEACREAFPRADECQVFMLLEQPEIGNVGFLGGAIVGEDGTLTIEGTVTSAGFARQWYETQLVSFLNTRFEVRLKDHGEPIEGLVEEMLATFRAGCNERTVLGAPDTAKADGTPGPNDCTEIQNVAFAPLPD